MEREPKYKLGQKVWFVAENENVCYGTIIMITPINYTLSYTIKMKLNSVGEVIKNTVWEMNILGDFNDDKGEIFIRAASLGVAREIDKRIIESLLSENKFERKIEEKPNKHNEENLEFYQDKFNTSLMGTVEPLYEYGLERDFGAKDDLAFIMGAIKKYGNNEGYYSDLVVYLMNMLFAFIRDIRKERLNNNHIDKENKPEWLNKEGRR